MKRFTKEDLKPGMIVECMDGRRFVVEDEDDLRSFKEDLTNRDASCLDIKRVYINNPVIETLFDDRVHNLIWERKEIKSITADEAAAKIEELTGEKVEIEPSMETMYGTLILYCQSSRCNDCVLEGRCNGFDSLVTPGKIKASYEKLMRERK